MNRTFLAHVTRLTACEGDGGDMVLVECQGGEGSVSWLSEAAPEIGAVVRVEVEEAVL